MRILWAELLSPAIEGAPSAWARLAAGRAAFVSPGVISLPARERGFSGGMLLLDPDGHAVRLAQE